MDSAKRLYRLVAALAALGLLATVIGLAAAASRTALSLPSARALAEACRQLLPSGVSVLALAVLGLAALGVVVFVRAARSCWLHARAERHFRGSLRVCGQLQGADGSVLVANDPEPRAFCAGYLRPRVFVSSGALARLSRTELEAIVAHERHHLRRRDPLRLLIVRVLADALFFLPAIRRLGDRYGALAEVAADEAAVRVAGPGGLASALLAFNAGPGAEIVVGVAPERVDHLLGARPRWELPASLVVAALVTLAGFAAAIVAVLALAGARVDLAMFVAQGCMALMCGLALTGAALGLLLRRRWPY
jgi:Zn-dependent protease with chaperone function